MAKRKKKKLCALDVALLILLALVVIFVGIVFWMFYKYQQEPETLIQYFLGSIAIELIVTGWIETAKQKRKGKEKNDDTEQGV